MSKAAITHSSDRVRRHAPAALAAPSDGPDAKYILALKCLSAQAVGLGNLSRGCQSLLDQGSQLGSPFMQELNDRLIKGAFDALRAACLANAFAESESQQAT